MKCIFEYKLHFEPNGIPNAQGFCSMLLSSPVAYPKALFNNVSTLTNLSNGPTCPENCTSEGSLSAPSGKQLGTFFVNGECVCSPFVTNPYTHRKSCNLWTLCKVYDGRFTYIAKCTMFPTGDCPIISSDKALFTIKHRHQSSTFFWQLFNLASIKLARIS